MSSMCDDKKEDCRKLHKLLHGPAVDKLALVRGLAIDKLAVIHILAHRDANYRSDLIQVYRNLYNEDLPNILETRLHTTPYGHLKKAMRLWMLLPHERYATILKDAFTKHAFSRKLNQILVEILWTKSTEEVNAIEQAYATLDGCRSLQDAIDSCVKDQYCKQLFIRQLMILQNHSLQKIILDAHSLQKAVTAMDTGTLIQIFTSKDFNELKSTFIDYKQRYRREIHEDLNLKGDITTYLLKGFSANCHFADFKKTLAIVIDCVSDLTDYFVKVLYKSMKRLGTSDDTLIRVIVTRAEIDMQNIKSVFLKNHGKALVSMVDSDTTYSYKAFLLAVLGAR